MYKTLCDEIPGDISPGSSDFQKIGQIRLDFSKLPTHAGVTWDQFSVTIEYCQIENWVKISPKTDPKLPRHVADQVSIRIPLYRGLMMKQGNYKIVV